MAADHQLISTPVTNCAIKISPEKSFDNFIYNNFSVEIVIYNILKMLYIYISWTTTFAQEMYRELITPNHASFLSLKPIALTDRSAGHK